MANHWRHRAYCTTTTQCRTHSVLCTASHLVHGVISHAHHNHNLHIPSFFPFIFSFHFWYALGCFSNITSI